MPRSSLAGLLVLCFLLANTASVLVMAANYVSEPVQAKKHATCFTADFLSSRSSYGASRHFDSKPCADRVYARERSRSLRYLFGPTVDKAINYQEYLESKSISLAQWAVELDVDFYMPVLAGGVYANLKDTSPAADSKLKKSERELTIAFDAYFSMPSPYVDQAVLNDPTHITRLEIVCFKTRSNPKKMMPKGDFIRKQIKKTGLVEQGRQIRKQQMATAYLGKDHTQRTYSQRVLENSKPRDGEEVYLLTLPEDSGPFCPGRFKDSQWTLELVIKFLTYAISPVLKGCDSESRIERFDGYLNNNGIIPGMTMKLLIQPSAKTFPIFTHAFIQHQKYRFLAPNSAIAVMLYQQSFIGDDLISPPIQRPAGMPIILLGTQRTLIQSDKSAICFPAMIDFMHSYPMKLPALRKLTMPFRIPKGLPSDAAKQAALQQLLEMTELNALEEGL